MANLDTRHLSAAYLAQFTLHRAQAAFVACTPRFSFYVGGVGAGKTMAGAARAIARALDATRYALHTALGRWRATRAYLDAMRRIPGKATY